MKIFIKEKEQAEETEVMIFCKEHTAYISRLKAHIEQFSRFLQVRGDKGEYQLPLKEIYYMESVEGRTCVYTKEEVYGNDTSLLQLEKKLRGSSFVRISKSMLLNVDYLKSVAPMSNHRMIATLTNGEKVMVGRAYITSLKDKLKEGL